MKKIVKNKKSKTNTLRIGSFLVLFILFGIVLVVLPTTRTNKDSYGATIPFTPVPAKSNLQLETFTLPSLSPSPSSSQAQPVKSSPVNQQPCNSFLPANSSPCSSGNNTPPHPLATIHPLISPVKSNGQLCSAADDSGSAVNGNCYCPDLTVTCKNGVGYGANGGLYPGVNPCGSNEAPGSGRYCVEKPVIYLYPQAPTLVNVQVITAGSVVVSNPQYPVDGWKNILANPDGTLQYEGEYYSELFYESSVNTFQQPQEGITIPTNQLSEKLNGLLDQLGLIGHEKQEFLAFWMPRLEALNSPYIFFSILDPSTKANIDTVSISPKPDTQIEFIAYFKAVSVLAINTLELPPTPERKGFVSVEWGGVIGN
jgi:hypothetical protein